MKYVTTHGFFPIKGRLTWGLRLVVALCLGVLVGVYASPAAAQQKVLVLTTATTDPDSDAIFDNAVAGFAAVVGATNVNEQRILGTSGAVTAATFTSAPGPYNTVVIVTALEPVATNNWTAIRAAIQSKAALNFVMFVDGCCFVNENLGQMLTSINTAAGLSTSVGAYIAAAANLPLNTNQPISTSFTAINPLYANVLSYIDNVPRVNTLYLPGGAAVPAATGGNITASGVFIPSSQSYSGTGACMFGVSDASVWAGPGFANPSGPNPPATIATAFMSAVSAAGSCNVGSLTLVKTVDNTGGGAATVNAFNVATSASPGGLTFSTPTGTAPVLTYTSNSVPVNSGSTYTLTEQNVTGYRLGSWSCVSGTGTPTVNPLATAGSVTVPNASPVVCSITNTWRYADLSVTKTNTPGQNANVDQATDTVSRGATTVYQITVTNGGPETVTGATVTDNSSGLTCTDLTCTSATTGACPATPLPAPAAFATGTAATLGTLATGQSATLNLTCTVN